MPRNKKIEDILEAWYRLDHCPHSERAKAKTALDSLLDAAIGNQAFTRDEILAPCTVAMWNSENLGRQTRSYELPERSRRTSPDGGYSTEPISRPNALVVFAASLVNQSAGEVGYAFCL